MPLASVDIVMGDTDLCPWDMGTFGSLSIRQFGPVLRAAAAEARAVLLQMAAERLQRAARPTSRSKDGVVRRKTDAPKHVTLRRAHRRASGSSAGSTARPALEAVADVHDRRHSRAAPRRDRQGDGHARSTPATSCRRARCTRASLRPPAHGATLIAADTSAAEARAGRARRARRRSHRRAARASRRGGQGARAGQGARSDAVAVDARRRRPSSRISRRRAPGAADGRRRAATWRRARSSAAQVVEQTVPRRATSRTRRWRRTRRSRQFEDGKVTVWAGTQTPFPLKTQVARALEARRPRRCASSRRTSAADSAARARRSRRSRRRASR